MVFKDRIEAGKKLAEKLFALKDQKDKIIIYALPRGGVIVADQIAQELKVPLDLVISRKISHPYDPEYAIAAICEEEELEENEEEISQIDKKWYQEEIKKQKEGTKKGRDLYLNGRKIISPKDKIAILVDDGIATGLTMFAAIRYLKKFGPQKVIVAIPVIPKDVFQKLIEMNVEVISCQIEENYLGAVGFYYEDFPQIEDEEVIRIMKKYL